MSLVLLCATGIGGCTVTRHSAGKPGPASAMRTGPERVHGDSRFAHADPTPAARAFESGPSSKSFRAPPAPKSDTANLSAKRSEARPKSSEAREKKKRRAAKKKKRRAARKKRRARSKRPVRSAGPAVDASESEPASITQPPQDPSEAACLNALRKDNVAFDRVAPRRAPGIAYPIQLKGEVGGVRIHGGRKNSPTRYLDCRLAQALLAWAPTLRAAGITEIEHYSMYRKQATVAGGHKPSGHAGGMAIDAARFTLADGTVLDVLEDWSDKTRGADPCRSRPGEGDGQRLMRDLVCRAADLDIFQTVITPHHNDAHRNHLHLEVNRDRPSWIR